MCQAIEWLGHEPLPVFVKHNPNILCIFNSSKSNDYVVVVKHSDGYGGYCPTINGVMGGRYFGAPIVWTRLEPYASY